MLNVFNFKRQKLRRKRTDYWLYFFDSYNIENVPEVEIRDQKGQVEYILKNDKLFLNQKSIEKYKIYKMPNKSDNKNENKNTDTVFADAILIRFLGSKRKFLLRSG